MYISNRAIVVRNFAIAIVNGAITLIILLIAPLGLMAVISNTFLVTVASFFTATIADGVIRFLQASRSGGEMPLHTDAPYSSKLDARSSHEIDR
ncbi:hypothetical protein PCC9214_05431 (plasmid) [Planktothrix tepida]|uniref:Uncharacterized protein n=1 Tax=Planktothrix tepida PCC 9214 TaxID=671072 RepID=A0A1J1LN40_9CYAN|nr:CRISPR-associated protein Csx18 [Planktothrix tepida]CAD5988650.1 hypothetical protein PCC9214_05431 [Planktothrix tepida]CUR33968.1 exported hypothetical protein [Planktothrix tepida PCC 9214]